MARPEMMQGMDGLHSPTLWVLFELSRCSDHFQVESFHCVCGVSLLDTDPEYFAHTWGHGAALLARILGRNPSWGDRYMRAAVDQRDSWSGTETEGVGAVARLIPVVDADPRWDRAQPVQPMLQIQRPQRVAIPCVLDGLGHAKGHDWADLPKVNGYDEYRCICGFPSRQVQQYAFEPDDHIRQIGLTSLANMLGEDERWQQAFAAQFLEWAGTFEELIAHVTQDLT